MAGPRALSSIPGAPSTDKRRDDSPESKQPKSPAPLVIEDTGKLYEGRTLSEWVKLLSDGDEFMRSAAAKGLARIRDGARPAEPALVEAMKDRNEGVRQYAAEALSNIYSKHPPTEVGLAALTEAVSDPNLYVSRNASQGLASAGPKGDVGSLALIGQLGNGATSDNARRALVAIGTATVVRDLTAALQNKNRPVRHYAAEILGGLGPRARSAAPALEKLVRDAAEVREARATAAEALTLVQAPPEGSQPDDFYQGKPLSGWVKLLSDENEFMRAAAAKALSKIGDEALPAEPALVEAVSDRNEWVRQNATRALFRIYSKHPATDAGLASLSRAVSDTDIYVSRNASQGLGAAGAKGEVGSLALIGQLGNGATWDWARRALLAIGTGKVVRDLTAALQNNDPLVRQCSAQILGELGLKAKSAASALEKLVNDAAEVRKVRAAAAEALSKVRPRE